jgi:hypothetical protein
MRQGRFSAEQIINALKEPLSGHPALWSHAESTGSATRRSTLGAQRAAVGGVGRLQAESAER